MMQVKNAVMLSISHRDWSMPKFVLFETNRNEGESINMIAERAFKQFEASSPLKDLRLLDFCYYGDVNIFKQH